MSRKLTQKEAEDRVNERCQKMNYELIDNFIYINDDNTLLHIRCKTDNCDWYLMYNKFVHDKNKCPECKKTKRKNYHRISQKEADDNIFKRCKEMDYILNKPFVYITPKSKIDLKCNKDNHEWKPTYGNFIYSEKGCPCCSGNLIPTQEEAEKIVNEYCFKNNYILLEPFLYKNNYSKAHLCCNIDKYDWYPGYVNIINDNTGCSKCSKVYKPTQEEAEEKIQQRCIEENSILIEQFKYISYESKMHLKCNICNYDKWKPSYDSFIRIKTGCPICGGTSKTTQEEAEKKVNERCKEMNYELLKPFIYNNAKTKIYLKCNICGYDKLNPSYDKFINAKQGCKKCTGTLLKTQEEAEKCVNDMCLIKHCELIKPFKYIKSDKTRLYLKCNICSYDKWNVNFSKFTCSDDGCPECGRKYKKSENRIKRLLDNNNINYIYQYRDKTLFGKQSLDFYLPEYSIAIEYQGKQHFKLTERFGGEKGFNEVCERDIRKYNICKNNNINILYFTYENNKIIPENYFAKVYTEEKDLINEIKR